MALIGKIRQKKWLLIGSLAAALALFILMLMFDNPNQSFGGSSNTSVGSIAGETIEYQKFNQIHDMLYSGAQTDGFSGRNYLWNYFVDEALVKKEAEEIGLGVSKPELLKLEFGPEQNRLSPVITARYQNQNTRQVDLEQLNQLKDIVTTPGKIDQMIKDQQLIGDFKYRWAHQEQEVIKDRLQTKLSNMVSKGMYTPNWMAEMIGESQNKKVDFLYVQVPYDEIENSEVPLEDADYQSYFNENKNKFLQTEETRKVEYVVFDVKPSAQDSADIRAEIAALVPDFRKAEDDSLFVETHLGFIDGAYFKKETLPAEVADTLMSMPIGEVYGPFLTTGSYLAYKVLDRKVIPDSVAARHILRRASDLPSLQAAQKTIDSLKNVIETGVNTFEEMATAYSEDASNAGKGGDLGTFAPGTMVKEFNDVCFFQAETGNVYSVVTQFGVHLIQVYDKKIISNEPSVRIANISRTIIPSQKTQDEVKEMALKLQEENKDIESLRKAAAAQGLTIETSPALKANDFSVGTLGVGQGSRELVRWAFGDSQNVKPGELGDVSPQIYSFQNQGEYHVSKYAVAALQSIVPAGVPSWKDVKSEIEPQVINRKKGELIKSQLSGLTNLQSAANKYGVTVDTATNVTFASAFIQAAGASEPDVVAEAFKVDLNQVSPPIAGTNGVYVVKPTNKPAAAAPNASIARQSSQQQARVQVAGKLMPSLRKNADIKDNRSRFF
ncbi:MAG: peptidylprolyl isomerase [Saprospiraceae bacterium]